MKKLITGICLGIALTATAVGGVFGAAEYLSASSTPKTTVMQASGFVGDIIAIPDYSEAGQKAENVIIDPNGVVYSGDKIKLATQGLYQVLYQIDGFTVKTESCLCKYRATDFFTVNQTAEAVGVATYKYLSEPTFTGLKYAVEPGAELAFEHIIDMSQKTVDDKLIELLIEPNQQGVLDFGQVILTFTDVEDDTKFFQVVASDGHLDSATSGGIAFVRAGANGQTAGGRNYRGNKVQFETADIYGSPAPFTFRAEFFEGETRYDYSLNLYYDSEDKAIYLKNSINEHYGQKFLIADFDDVVTFGGGAWDGFVSDKVKLSITFDKFQTESGNLIVKEVDGIDFSSEIIVDEEAPVLTVDMQGEVVAPNAKLQQTYAIFEATAVDFYDGEIEVQTKVQYQTLTDGKWYDVQLIGDTFVTNRVGRYAIIYTATDRFGNVAEERKEFYCFGSAEKITVTDTDLSVSSATVYDFVPVKGTQAVRAEGGNGTLHIECEVFAPDGSNVEITNDGFVATQVGEYVVRYTATDYFGDFGYAEERVEIRATDKPVFIDQPTLPEVLVAGFTYHLPEIQAVVCEGTEVKPAVVKAFVNGTESKDSFTAPATGSVDVEYRAYYQGDDGEYERICSSAPIVDGQGGKDQAAYFYNADGNISVVENKETVDLSFAKDGSLVFANVLNNKSFDLQAAYEVEKVKFAAMRIVLADSASSTSVTFKLALTMTGITLTLPHADSVPLANNSGLFAIKYQHGKFVVQDVKNNPCAVIVKDDAGNPFAGFKGGVYMKIFFDEVYGESALSLKSLNGQALGYRKASAELGKDTTGPVINVNGSYIYKQRVGTELEIYSAEAFDVLGQVAKLTVIVQEPNGDIVFSGEPTTTQTIKLEKIGIYRVIYSAVDSYGNQAPLVGSPIEALDSTTPTYTINPNFKEYYKVGAGVKLPELTVTDDYSDGYCDVFVELPTGELRLVMHYINEQKVSYLTKLDDNHPASFKVDENTFRLEMAGQYKVIFVFYDEGYNSEIVQYTFTAVQ